MNFIQKVRDRRDHSEVREVSYFDIKYIFLRFCGFTYMKRRRTGVFIELSFTNRSRITKCRIIKKKSTGRTDSIASPCDGDCNAILVGDFFQTTDNLSMRSAFLVYIHVITCRRKHFERIYSVTLTH